MHLRVARHTNNLEAVKNFYINILNFELLGSFENHDNYNGIFLGFPNADWHIEFTASAEKALHQFDPDDLLVLYPETKENYEKLLQNIEKNQIALVMPKNPYWIENGKMIVDPDGYRIVISNLRVKH